jgi:adenosylhomocysteine nucleosidase
VVALPFEGACVAGRHIKNTSCVPLDGNSQLRVAGMGATSARAAAEQLIAWGANRLLSIGVAGALDPGLKAGDVVLPVTVRDAGGNTYHPDPRWRSCLRQHLPRYMHVNDGGLFQVEKILDQAKQKQALFDPASAVAADMESAAIADIAASHGIPFLAVRVILDIASMSLPRSSLQAADGQGRVSSWRLIRGLCRYPYELASYPRLYWFYRRAGNSLTTLGQIGRPLFYSDLDD